MNGRTKNEIQSEIETLSRVEHLVETNQGTYGSREAASKVGTGDPAFAERNVYETVGGSRRATGPSEDLSPGLRRRINSGVMSRDRERLAALKAALRSAK